MPAQFIKGALISFIPAFGVSLPNVVVFQYNPETITHTWSIAAPEPQSAKNPSAAPGVPGEQFSFSLSLDSNEMIANGSANPVAAALGTATGVYSRLAALEMLQYPPSAAGGGLLGAVSAGISAAASSLTGSASAPSQTVPQSDVPTVLFVYGPGRILPVRITALSITEKLYDPLLNPTQATVQITLRVLTPTEIAGLQGITATLANAAYNYSQGLRQVLALANLGDAAASIIGMLPGPL